MNSNTSTTRRARIARRAVLAAAAAGIGLSATAMAAPAAFASGTPGPTGQFSGVVVVTSTLSIAPSASSFTMNAAPGTTTSTTPFAITCGSSDSAGYSLVEGLTTQFGSIPDTAWTTDSWTITPATGSGFTDTLVSYDAAGDAVPVFATPQLSGNAGNIGGHGPAPFSTTAGTDVITTTVHLSLPSNYPGSPASGYAGAFTYQIIGS